jgi:heme/copper-type cytochrome/quinol oxidase subunit 2
MKYAGMIILLIAVAGGFMFVSNSQQNPDITATNSVPADTTATPTEMTRIQDMNAAMVIDVEAGSFYYTPDTITVQKGQPVKIVMTSVDMMHDFIIDELDVQIPVIQNGDTGEVEFTPNTVGEFEYYCSVGAHRANGQVGTLVVTE